MDSIPVSSSWINNIGYDSDESTLDVVLDNGGSYTYGDVPESIYKAFIDAPSKGNFFVTQVKNRFAIVG